MMRWKLRSARGRALGLRFLCLFLLSFLIAQATGCASSGPPSDDYYRRRGSIHADSFPGTYTHGGYYGYGRGRY